MTDRQPDTPPGDGAAPDPGETPQRREGDKGIYRRISNWLDRNPLVAYLLVIGMAVYAIASVSSVATDAHDAADSAKVAADHATVAVHKINDERAKRLAAAAVINHYFCAENLRQDNRLRLLLQASLSGPRPKHLTHQQHEALRIFQDALHGLSKPIDCRKVTQSLLQGKPLNQLKPGQRK